MTCRKESAGDPGIAAAEALAHQHDLDPTHFLHVCAVALDLFDATAGLHHLGGDERRVLQAAALLHDSGYPIRPDEHHKGVRDLVLASELEGFSSQEHRLIACVARYHRKSHPAASHGVYGDLGPRDRAIVERLAAILRIADGLDRSHMANTKISRLECTDTAVRIVIAQHNPDRTDLLGAKRKRRLFEEVFGVRVALLLEGDA